MREGKKEKRQEGKEKRVLIFWRYLWMKFEINIWLKYLSQLF
jgi:hypothetical protein